MKDNTNTETNKESTVQDGAKKAFAYQLKIARERTGRTQSELFQLLTKKRIPSEEDPLACDKSPLTRFMSYNQYESAKNFPPLPELRRLAYHCNVSTDELLGMYDARYFYRLIKKVFHNTSITATNQPLGPGEWPNDTNKKLQIKVAAPTGQEYVPSIAALERIRKNCWEHYQMLLTQQIANYLNHELFLEKFDYSEEQLAFFEKLTFIALNETFKEPVIERNQTVANAFESFQNKIMENHELYQKCFQNSTDIAGCFYLMTNINPANTGNKIPALFKLYALDMNKDKIIPQTISPEEFKKALDDMIEEFSLVKKLFGTDLSYLRGENPFNNEFYRFLLSRIKTFTKDFDKHNKPLQLMDSGLKANEHNRKVHLTMKERFLHKLVTGGSYWEDGKWKPFTDYRPTFLANTDKAMTADEIKKELNRELFGTGQGKPKPTPSPSLRPTKDIKNDGHGNY